MKNKFDEYYEKKNIYELMILLVDHRMETSALDSEWHEGLKEHLSKKKKTTEHEKLIEHILQTDPAIIRSENIRASINQEYEAMINADPNKKMGKAILGTINYILAIIFAGAGYLFIHFVIEIWKGNNKGYQTVVQAKSFDFLAGFIAALIIFISLYCIYNQLKKTGEALLNGKQS